MGRSDWYSVEIDDKWATPGIVHSILMNNIILNKFYANMGESYEFDPVAFLPDWYKKS